MQVVAIVKACAKRRVPMIPYGGATSIEVSETVMWPGRQSGVPAFVRVGRAAPLSIFASTLSRSTVLNGRVRALRFVAARSFRFLGYLAATI